jgi:hypothetical protein
MNFDQLTQACEQAHNYLQKNAVSAINQSLTIRNWLFGQYIVEYEQNGEDRAKYGTELLKKLAARLSGKSIKGIWIAWFNLADAVCQIWKGSETCRLQGH